MDLIRDAVGWRSYGQRNPLFEYQEEAFELFTNQGLLTRHLIIYDLIRASLL
jgi:preprotein translocase subunit SecA